VGKDKLGSRVVKKTLQFSTPFLFQILFASELVEWCAALDIKIMKKPASPPSFLTFCADTFKEMQLQEMIYHLFLSLFSSFFFFWRASIYDKQEGKF
jgi:hypothetical protein